MPVYARVLIFVTAFLPVFMSMHSYVYVYIAHCLSPFYLLVMKTKSFRKIHFTVSPTTRKELTNTPVMNFAIAFAAASSVGTVLTKFDLEPLSSELVAE